ncbi:hypothetical protein PsAD2_02344 [Pseudovibrio axinellae]|uniref:Uncharacterized protein n=1 Tax=Pseudovibrio axinellae TaxID=989403 RepID=A0A165YGP3_9HYPH|nr:HD family hydrolase [Pseudovibrio axinellae]KZL18828.1 hypothetical protein PsAD2_02344 [Pseudovibrio axinellae]SEP91319.1 hypothetical protein SAMN05421798_101697 [Pseudovibrio axinellae]
MCAELSSSSPRAWQRMLSGKRLNLLAPSSLDVELSDIAHGLARVARWNGQTFGDHAFSVAQHCVVVEEIALMLEPDLAVQWRIAILLHDAPEYVIGDMISPFKNVMGGTYKSVEEQLHHAIHKAFDLPADLPETISKLSKRADIISAYLEAIHLAGFSRQEANKIFGKPDMLSDRQLERLEGSLQPLPTKDAQEAFLAKFDELNLARKSVECR